MADLEIQDLSGNTLVACTRPQAYPWDQLWDTNVVVRLSVGAKAKSSTRGPARLINRMAFEDMAQLQAAHLMAFCRDYGGGAKPFNLVLQGAWQKLADGSALADGSVLASGSLQCRYYGGQPRVSWVRGLKYSAALDFEQDL